MISRPGRRVDAASSHPKTSSAAARGGSGLLVPREPILVIDGVRFLGATLLCSLALASLGMLVASRISTSTYSPVSAL